MDKFSELIRKFEDIGPPADGKIAAVSTDFHIALGAMEGEETSVLLAFSSDNYGFVLTLSQAQELGEALANAVLSVAES